MKQERSILILACCALLACFVAFDAAMAVPHEVYFKSGTILPEAGMYDIPSAPYGQMMKSRVHVLLQLDDYLQPGDRERLADAGIELLSYFPDRAYAAVVSPNLDAAILPALGVRHVSRLWADYKLHPRVTAANFGSWSEYSNGARIFAVEIMPDIDLVNATGVLTKLGYEPGHVFEAAHTLLVAANPEKAMDLASLDFVAFVDECPPPPDEVNDVVRTRLHVNEVQADPYNLDGTGVTLLVYDGGMIDSTHQDFGDRVTWNETAVIADHATHVAGTAGGDGAESDGVYRGMAPNVRIISGQYDACVPYCLYESPNDFEDDYTRARQVFDADITTNSIGANIDPNNYPCEWFGDYETTSRLLDRMTRGVLGRPLIMFFAAGNERGGANCAINTYRCMSVPASAKNIITCGATTSTDASAGFSSWGPTDDGRIKPEVSATGVSVTSCRPGPAYGYQDMDGTSMATPATAGTACLIMQKWHQVFPGAPNPLPETMKAIMINSTTDINPVGPDFQTGFGLVNGLKSVQNLELGGVLESALEIGEIYERTFQVAAGMTALDVSIAWSDVPGAGNVTPTLVNDLDLRLIAPDLTEHRPWVLLPQNPTSPASRGDDSINVCERVTVPNPAAGTWTLQVSGQINSGASQTFGVCGNVPLVTAWATINGQLRDGGGSGVPGEVAVIGSAQNALTDATGNYVISVPAFGTYDIRARAYGYVPATQQVVEVSGIVTRNFTLQTSQLGTVHGVVTNQFDTPIPGAIIRFSFPNVSIPNDTTDAAGNYSVQLPGANQYEVRCVTPSGDGFATVTLQENGNVTQDFEIVDQRYNPTGPDAYGYLAYEETDPGLSAVYSWTEISPAVGGPGTVIAEGAGNDWVTTITAPFPIRFYGLESTTLRVSADGWVGVGTGTDGQSWINVGIPTAADPSGMICLFWDDMNPAVAGDLAQYHDAAGGRFIIEYHDVAHFNPTTNRVTAQVVFYDQQTRPTMTGDNEFELLYQSVDYEDLTQDADATIGAESRDGADGLQIVYGGQYDPSVFALTDQYALRFTTGVIAGYGAVQGQLTMHPAPDYTQVAVTMGAYTITPAADGSFFLDDVVARTYTMNVAMAGYEPGSNAAVVVDIDDTTTVDFDLYRLDPARNLVGEYDWQGPTITLRWDPAISTISGQNIHERGALDAFLSYEIWLGGRGLQGSTQDTFFVYPVTQSRAYNFWILARYDGGDADTSNHYRITVDLAAEDITSLIPDQFYLAQNYPNPFNPSTTIEYGLPQSADVRIDIFNVLGKQVATLVDEQQAAGIHRVQFDASSASTGIYYCRMRAGEFSSLQKMLLLK